MKKILVIEDNADMAALVELHLMEENFHVDVAHDGMVGYQVLTSGDYDLLILDLNVPSLDGLQICAKLRERNIQIPIIMLTERSSETDKVLGLETGADDYLTKPYSVSELVARVRALLRRAEFSQQGSELLDSRKPIVFGDLQVDCLRRRVTIANKKISLTAKEFDLLAFMVRRPGRPFTRGELLNFVWDYYSDGYEHTVSSHINRLRNKIEVDPKNPLYILTEWGVGYRFTEEAELAERIATQDAA